MIRSIKESRKLFTIEGVRNGQVNIKTSKHLLSLPEEEQVEVLTAHLKNLKRDFSRYESSMLETTNGHDDELDKVQLQLLIQVTESLLNQI